MIEITKPEETKKEKDIILDYQIKGNKIIINFDKTKFGSRKFVVDKTKENERIIINRMTEQVKELDEDKTKKKYDKWSNILIYSLTSSCLLTSVTLACFAFSITSLPFVALTAASYALFFKSISTTAKLDKKMLGIAYVKNEEKINDSIAENENILASAPKKVQHAANMHVDEPAFDINTINQLNYDDLKQLLEVIERNETFGFECESEPVKTLVKDMNKEK